MRKLLAVGAILAAAGCSAQPPAAPTVTWDYAPHAGEGVSPTGPTPAYSQTYDMTGGDAVTTGQAPKPNLAYGAEGDTGTMVQLSPQARQKLAAPTAQPQQQQAAPGPHS